MYHLQQWAAVQELHRKGTSIRGIAKQLEISRNTVRKLLAETEEPHYHRSCYSSKIDPYRDQILEWRCSPYEFNGTRIYRELQKRGYTGSIGPVYRYLRRIDEDTGGLISSRATVRIETPPGDQAQFDWSPYQMEIGGRIRNVYCFSMILACSRKKAICFSLKDDADAIYEAIQELFTALGGITLELLIDNPKALVLENNPKTEDEIRYNPHALLLARHLGTELNACPCYWPRKKGKIEKPFQYIEEQFVKGRSFATMEELNAAASDFIKEWNNTVHTTTKRIPDEYYLQEEKNALLPLPKDRYYVKEAQRRIVSPDSFVSIDASTYSVPVKYVGKTVFFRVVYGFRILIYDSHKKFILSVERADEKGTAVRNQEHYRDIAPKISTSIPQIRRDFTTLFTNGKKYLDAADRKFDQPTHHARKILELSDLYDHDLLDYFIGQAVEKDVMDIHSFRKMLKEESREALKTLTEPSDEKASSINPELSRKANEEGLIRNLNYYDLVESGVASSGK